MTQLAGRQILGLFSGLAALGLTLTQAEAAAGMALGRAVPNDPEMVVNRARTLAAAYASPPAVSADKLGLSCDAFQAIWFDTRHTLFRGTPGTVQAEFFVAGPFFQHKIGSHAVEKGQAREVVFQLRTFDWTDQFPTLPEGGTGFAGFRLLGWVEAEGRFPEYAVFQGGSYFRAIVQGQAYGVSARGLALYTAGDGPEEFPVFRDFWIEAAEPGAHTDTIRALKGSPLANPEAVEVSVFADTAPRGFGLKQRARKPGDCNDLVAHYEHRPVLWVEPRGDWGQGAAMLVEIPTDKEIIDNIAAFWGHGSLLVAGSEHRFDYGLNWCAAAPAEGAVAPVIATRTGARVVADGRLFAIDFAAHPAVGDNPAKFEVRVSTSAGNISGQHLQLNPATGGMRLDITLNGDAPLAELRAETLAEILAESRAKLRADLWRSGQRVAKVWLNRWVQA